MGLRDRVALVRTTLCILFISQAFCMPKIKKNIKEINKYCNAQNRIKQEKSKIENNIEALYKKYNFPQTEFTSVFKPSYEFDNFNQNTLNEAINNNNNNNAFQRFKSKNARQIASKLRKPHRNLHRKLDGSLDACPKLSAHPNFGYFPDFPEVEYPMVATDLWTPNYWCDFFKTTDNNQNNGYDINCKPCKLVKNKYKSIKVPSKAQPFRPVQNNTKEEICPITTCSTTTKPPYVNNFLTKENSSLKKSTNQDGIANITSMLENYNNSIENCNSGEDNNRYLTNMYTEICRNDTCESEPEKFICPNNANDTADSKERSDTDPSQGKESDIEIDEEFTTDEPEYPLSTPLPFDTDNTWKETQVIDSYRSPSYSDELNDYFIAVES